jgi:hypothetical protein
VLAFTQGLSDSVNECLVPFNCQVVVQVDEIDFDPLLAMTVSGTLQIRGVDVE